MVLGFGDGDGDGDGDGGVLSCLGSWFRVSYPGSFTRYDLEFEGMIVDRVCELERRVRISSEPV